MFDTSLRSALTALVLVITVMLVILFVGSFEHVLDALNRWFDQHPGLPPVPKRSPRH